MLELAKFLGFQDFWDLHEFWIQNK
jgi:hypothetical protein